MQHNGEKSALSRRAFVGTVAAGAAVALVGGGVGERVAASTQAPPIEPLMGNGPLGPLAAAPQTLPDAPAPALSAAGDVSAPSAPQPPWRLLNPLSAGAMVSAGWRLTDLSAPENGSCVVTLTNQRGRQQRVHLCANAGRPQGLVYTKRFDLVVMNGGQGDLPTEEGFAQAVAELAHVLATNERAHEHEEVIVALLPQAERTERFGTTAKLR